MAHVPRTHPGSISMAEQAEGKVMAKPALWEAQETPWLRKGQQSVISKKVQIN